VRPGHAERSDRVSTRRGGGKEVGDEIEVTAQGARGPAAAEKADEAASAASKGSKGTNATEGAAVAKANGYPSFAKLLMGVMVSPKQQREAAEKVLDARAVGVESKTVSNVLAQSLTGGPATPKPTDEAAAAKAPKPQSDPAKALAGETTQSQSKKAILEKADLADATRSVGVTKTTPAAVTAQVAAKPGGEAAKNDGAAPLSGAIAGRPSARSGAVASTKPAGEAATGAGDGKLITKAMEEITSAVSQRSEKTAVETAAPRAVDLSGRTAGATGEATDPFRQDAQRAVPEGTVKSAGDEIQVTAQGAKAPAAVEAPLGNRPARSVSSDNSATSSVQNAQPSEARSVTETGGAGPSRRTAGAGLPRQVTDNLINSAKLYQAGRNSRIEVRLSPPELGKIVISIRKQGDTIEGVLAVERPETRRALEDAAAQVVRNLAESGVNVRRIQVVQTGHETSARADAHEQPGGQLGSQSRHGAGSADSDSPSYDIPATGRTEDPVAVQQAVEDGGLNLLV